jgi:hypothetical protein
MVGGARAPSRWTPARTETVLDIGYVAAIGDKP